MGHKSLAKNDQTLFDQAPCEIYHWLVDLRPDVQVLAELRSLLPVVIDMGLPCCLVMVKADLHANPHTHNNTD